MYLISSLLIVSYMGAICAYNVLIPANFFWVTGMRNYFIPGVPEYSQPTQTYHMSIHKLSSPLFLSVCSSSEVVWIFFRISKDLQRYFKHFPFPALNIRHTCHVITYVVTQTIFAVWKENKKGASLSSSFRTLVTNYCDSSYSASCLLMESPPLSMILPYEVLKEHCTWI